MPIIELIGTEIAIDTANTVNDGHIVRVVNMTSANAVLTVANTGGTVANVSLSGGSDIIVKKLTVETLAGAGLKAVKVSVTG